MTHTNSFEEDLKSGQIIERDVLKLLKTKHPSAFIIPGYCKEYDIFIPEISRGYEVKQDYKSKYTGNIVVEVSMFDKPSALMTTKAHVWVFVTHYKYAFIKPERIKDCIVENNLQMRTFTSRGDSHPKNAYLIKEDLLFSYAHNIVDKS